MGKSLEKDIFAYPKLQERVRTESDREKVRSVLKECRASFNSWLVKTVLFCIEKTFRGIYDGISFEIEEGVDFEQALKTQCCILVPNHQSHADYVALGHTLYNRYKLPIYVAGGINLNIFPIGPFFRRMGCFFIRRSFGGDILYKLTLEAYLYHLLKERRLIEFFFEGGRSRTGKILPPRFGIFSMILEAYAQGIDHDLTFFPVAITHEHLPENKAHTKELFGHSKKKEGPTQLFKIFRLFSLRMGTIHIKVGKPLKPELSGNMRRDSHKLAFECYRQIGRQMIVTPTSLVAMILLDHSQATSTWQELSRTAELILDYCQNFSVPLSDQLKGEDWEEALKHALSDLIANRKVQVIQSDRLDETFFMAKKEKRIELLYLKNTILHHFIVPYIISSAWVHVFNGSLKDSDDLRSFLLQQRERLKYEFYLPTVKELMTLGLRILGLTSGVKVTGLDQAMELTTRELGGVISRIGVFSKGFNSIFETYYLALSAIKHIGPGDFTKEEFLKVSKEIYKLEMNHGRLIRYPESFSWPTLQNALNYFQNQEIITKVGGRLRLLNEEKLNTLMDSLSRDLTELLTIGHKMMGKGHKL